MSWTEKSALELLLKKCKEYIDEKIENLLEVNFGANIMGAYTKLFDTERLRTEFGNNFLSIGKFREFLDWLHRVFGYFESKIADIYSKITDIYSKITNLTSRVEYLEDNICTCEPSTPSEPDTPVDPPVVQGLVWVEPDGDTFINYTLGIGESIKTCEGYGSLTVTKTV